MTVGGARPTVLQELHNDATLKAGTSGLLPEVRFRNSSFCTTVAARILGHHVTLVQPGGWRPETARPENEFQNILLWVGDEKL